MKNTIIILAVLVLMTIPIPSALSTPYLYAATHGYNMDDWSDGGSGTTVLEHLDISVELVDPYVDWTLLVHFRADVTQGKMGADLLSHTIAPGPGRTGPYATADADMIDYFHIDAGTTGLPDGAEVQIRFLSGFDGNILLQGSSSGGCYVHYDSYLNKPEVGHLAEFNTNTSVIPSITNMYPPVDQTVDAPFNQIVNVNIGDVLNVHSHFSMDLNGSAYGGEGYGYPYSEGDNNLAFFDTSYARIGYVAGYEGLDIWSDGGALIVPEPATIALLGLGGLILLRRNRRFNKK